LKLPNADDALAGPAKVRDYLLAAEHPTGRGKARFFSALGFTRANWVELQRALEGLAREGDAVPGPANRFGQKHIVRGLIEGPNGRAAQVASVWIILHAGTRPRLLTAYPGGPS